MTDLAFGTRIFRFSREVYVEQDDFHEVPPHAFRRLAPGREVRLRYAYLVTCQDVVKAQQAVWSSYAAPTTPTAGVAPAPAGEKSGRQSTG